MMFLSGKGKAELSTPQSLMHSLLRSSIVDAEVQDSEPKSQGQRNVDQKDYKA